MIMPVKLGSSLLVKAVLVWTGWQRSSIPLRDDALLISRFGAELAARLLIEIKSLENAFYSSDAR